MSKSEIAPFLSLAPGKTCPYGTYDLIPIDESDEFLREGTLMGKKTWYFQKKNEFIYAITKKGFGSGLKLVWVEPEKGFINYQDLTPDQQIYFVSKGF